MARLLRTLWRRNHPSTEKTLRPKVSCGAHEVCGCLTIRHARPNHQITVQLAELTCIAYPTRKGRSSVAASFCHQLHASHPLRKGVVTIDSLNFTNDLGVYRPALPAALGVRQFVEGPASWFPRFCGFHGVLSFSQASQDCSTRIFETGGWMR